MAKRMSDSALVDRARERQALKAQVAQLEDQVKAIDADIMAEFDRRQVDAVEHAGVKVRVLASTQKTFDVERAKSSLSQALFRRITMLVVSKPLVVAEVEAGRLSQDDVDGFTELSRSAPYVRVSGAAA